MTDKKIIIDGVDVSRCTYIVCKATCKNTDCDYKRLQRKTQECEELKEENQRLKMQLCNDCGERDDYNIPCKMIRDLNYGLRKEIEENDRYRKALEEIEEAIATYSSKHQYSIANDLYNQILDIINKAKGE